MDPFHLRVTTLPDDMARSASVEPPKSAKRKGTRSVSTLTPTQLARKRANDREAQRAIRARTKEHIERLEKELEDMKSKRNRDQTLQNLLQRNRALEEELFRLRETLGIANAHHYPSSSMYDDSLNGMGSTAAVASPRSSPFTSQPDFGTLPLGSAYIPLSETTEHWTHAIPPHSIASTVSSPSSTGNGDEFNGPTYIPTSIPSSSMMEASAMTAPATVPGLSPRIKREYDELETEPVFPIQNPPMQQQFIHQPQQPQQPQQSPPQQQQQQEQQQQQQQQWNMYSLYYPPSSVH